MKTVTLVVVLLFFGALHIQAQSGRTDQHRMRAEQLSYEEFAKSVEWTRSRLMEFREFTRLLFEHCNLEKVREQGLFDTYGLPKDTTVIFEVPLEKLDEYSILDWAVQYIGFENLMLSITGYGLVSRAEILRLKVENMKLSNAPADASQKLVSVNERTPIILLYREAEFVLFGALLGPHRPAPPANPLIRNG